MKITYKDKYNRDTWYQVKTTEVLAAYCYFTIFCM